MLMAAVAYNLKKLLKWQGRKANTAVNALQKPLKDAFSLLFCLFRLPAHSPVLVPQTNIVF
jgi:hypothetical protein